MARQHGGAARQVGSEFIVDLPDEIRAGRPALPALAVPSSPRGIASSPSTSPHEWPPLRGADDPAAPFVVVEVAEDGDPFPASPAERFWRRSTWSRAPVPAPALNAPLPGHGALRRSAPMEGPRAVCEGWERDENVMDGLRVTATDAALSALGARFSHAAERVLLGDIRAHYEERGAGVTVSVIDRLERFERTAYFGREDVSALAQTLRLVWAALHAWVPAAGGESLEAGRANMRAGLGHNLADCVGDAGWPVCPTGHRGQMVKALGGYFDEVRVVSLTPQELVNEVAAGVQEELEGAAPTEAQLDAFEARCRDKATSLYGADAELVEALPPLLEVARAALRE